MTTLDLTDGEERALVRLLRSTIEDARYPFAPRYDPPEGDPGKARTARAAAADPLGADPAPSGGGSRR